MVDWAICVICSLNKIINLYPICIDSWHLGALNVAKERERIVLNDFKGLYRLIEIFILTLPTVTWNGRTLAPDHLFLLHLFIASG